MLAFGTQHPPKKKNFMEKKLDIMKKKHHTQNAVSWQVSADGQRMIGHMILRKNLEGEDILGLKIVGGTSISPDRIGAMIEKVKRGSIADKEGHLQPGKNLLLPPIRLPPTVQLSVYLPVSPSTSSSNDIAK